MGFVKIANRVTDLRMIPEQAAYVAGLIDGEGTIGLRVKHRKGGKAHQFDPALRIANTNLALLEAVITMTGNGQIFADRRGTGQRACYDWALSANQIRHVLPQVLPYLIAKKRQAECVLRFLELVRYPQGVAEADIPEVMALKEELQRLNQRGLTDAEEQEVSLKEPRCSTAGCQRQSYRGHPVCYQHWRENRDVSRGSCQNCGVEIEIGDARKRFCSQQCQAAHWYKTVDLPRIEAEKAQREAKPCLRCGKPVDRSRYKEIGRAHV